MHITRSLYTQTFQAVLSSEGDDAYIRMVQRHRQFIAQHHFMMQKFALNPFHAFNSNKPVTILEQWWWALQGQHAVVSYVKTLKEALVMYKVDR